MIPVNESVIPVNESVIPANESVIPVDESVIPITESLVPVEVLHFPTGIFHFCVGFGGNWGEIEFRRFPSAGLLLQFYSRRIAPVHPYRTVLLTPIGLFNTQRLTRRI